MKVSAGVHNACPFLLIADSACLIPVNLPLHLRVHNSALIFLGFFHARS
jgi:hypothetical protein